MARQLGAHHVIEPGPAAGEAVLDLTEGRGADVVFECAGVAPLLQTAVDLTRRDGVVALLGFIPGEATIKPSTWLGKEVRVIGSVAFAHDDLVHVMGLLADGRVQVAPLHTRTISLEELEPVLADLAAGRADDTKVLVDPRR
jgi:(R,R)-butanediol dehydrogenase/meso-butanediol dehydrogenase/diacetyl reductase